MKLNLEEMRDIARTLPIGYYLGRKVPVFVEEGQHAYCDVVKGDVHIGVGLLQIAADHIDAKDAAEWDRETLLRCLLYHEIGHLLLTPKWCKSFRVKNANGNSYREDNSNRILNIFEDERLECILSKYFMGVKFRKFVKLVCKGEGGGRKDDISKIYRAIRLRDAPKDVSDAVDAAIRNLAHIISVTTEWGYDSAGKYGFNLGLYSDEVNALVKKILDSKEESGGGGGESQQSQGQSQTQSQGHGQSKQDSPEQPAPKEQSEQDKSDGEQKDEQKDGKSDGESDDKSDADDKPDAEDDSKAEENSGGDGDGGDGSDGESDKPDEEDSEGDDGGGDADGEGDDDGDADADEGESKGDGDQGDGDESDEDSDGDAKGDGDDADDSDDAGGDDADGGVDGDAGEDESSDGDATGDEADASGTDDTNDTEDAEDTDGKTSCAVSGVLTLPPEYLKEVADKVFATPTSDIENVLRRFAQRIAKQKGAQAAGRWSALTGRIDPRRDAQDKDRIFRRSSDVGDAINTAVHLTLWVDTSGSFCRSVPLLNQILAATYRAMKMSGGKLDVDVVKMNYGAEVVGQNDWQIVAHGGNNINHTYVGAWRKTRKKNKRNIDVVVFDGEACGYYGNAKLYIDEIVKQIWDSPDCHLVIDRENEAWAKELKRAHVTLLTGNYAESLRDEVVKLLDRIL